MITICLSIILAFWFQYEFNSFAYRINKQIYQDANDLYPLDISFSQFIQKSHLKQKKIFSNNIFITSFITISLIFIHSSTPILITSLVLTYLSWLDYYYKLTDIRYIFLIFVTHIAYLIFYYPNPIAEPIFNLFITSIFFILLNQFCQIILNKELLGIGDILLFIAISPIFNLEQMLQLELVASVSGLSFTLGYFCKFRRKIDRLPFIPFISFATFLLFLLHFPY